MSKEKTKAGLFLKNIIAPIVRGAVKQIPIVGTPAMEIISNITGPKDEPKKHSWVSIIVQSTIAIAVLWAFFSKTITIQEVIDLLRKGVQILPS